MKPAKPMKPRKAARAGVPLLRAGFDEAGLGPTLGPLVVAGFATEVEGARDRDDRGPIDDLRGPLAALIGEPGDRQGRLEVGDSKKIHTGSRKLARIERTALATVAWIHGTVPTTVAELFERVVDTRHEQPGDRRAPWWADLDEPLPIACDRDALEDLGAGLRAQATAAGIRPLWYRADVLSAARINRELALEEARVDGTKNTWATHAVLRLAADGVETLRLRPGAHDRETLAIWCDKAGGRQAYAEPLRRAFPWLAPAAALQILDEQRAQSRYALAPDDRPALTVGFVMGGDRLDPRISWASILAKYLRELLMRGLNRHFQARIPELRATAGYPEDARRFIAAVEAVLGEGGGLGRDAWIRCK